jgi:NadR type nicotinamide-nucleotide adenylyltransferase
MLKKIVVIGPESTGKSTLCTQLAAHYKTQWCPEYAREYLLKHGMNYKYDDLLTIAKEQILLEEKYSRLPTPDSRLLIIDTDMYVMKVWCEFVYQKCHRFILDQIVERKYDLYLLCKIDLPWIPDVLREYPDLERRVVLYQMYKDLMVNQSVPWVEIDGDYDERLRKAIIAVNALITK